jgi:hypothetical protein
MEWECLSLPVNPTVSDGKTVIKFDGKENYNNFLILTIISYG